MTRSIANKGITLIALVIMMMILLILVGISIVSLTGENGILNKAQTAREKINEAGAKEKVQVAVMASYGEDAKINNNSLKTNLDKVEGIKNVPDIIENFPITVEVDTYTVKIKENGEVILEGEIKDSTEEDNQVIKPAGTKVIEENGEYEVSQYEKVKVNVPTYEPNSSLKITEKSNNIDVSNYQYADTTELFTLSEISGLGNYWDSGEFSATKGINSVNVGFIPKIIVFNKRSSNALLLYNSLKSKSMVYTYRGDGISEIKYDSTVTDRAHIRTVGITTTFFAIDDSTWDWIAIKE